MVLHIYTLIVHTIHTIGRGFEWDFVFVLATFSDHDVIFQGHAIVEASKV